MLLERKQEVVSVWERVSEIYGKRDQEREMKEEEWQYGEIIYLIYLPS